MKLKELRENIDEIDQRIIHLLEKRFDIVEKIAKLKSTHGLEIEDNAREDMVLKNWMKATSKIQPEFIKKIVNLVLDYSKNIQSKGNSRRGRKI